MLIAVFLVSSLFAGQGYADNKLVWEIMQGVNRFGSELYQNVTKEEASFVSSPLSADFALAMLMVGAGSDMFQKIASVLHVHGDKTLVEGGYQALSTTILKRKRDVTLEIANKLYMIEKVKPEYQQAVKNIFQSEVEQLNMKNKDESIANINNWVKSKTHGKIENILGKIPDDTIAIALNTVYFCAQWKNKFNPEGTTEVEFHLNSKSSKSIPMMTMDEDLLFGTQPDFNFDALKLYYSGEDTSMLILLPKETDGLAALEANIPVLNITRISQSLALERVGVLLPKFKIETVLELTEPLKKMGLGSIFEFSRDFPSITDKEIRISKITQKTFINVTEEGTEAASATEIIPEEATEPPPTSAIFRADHPFMFILLDELTGGSLFMGRFTGQ